MRLLSLLFLLFSALPLFAQAPGKPTNFSATAGSSKSVVLSWSPPAGTPVPTGYHVHRALASGGSYERITSFGQIGASATSFTDSSAALVAGTAYLYQVRAYVGTSEETTLEGEPTDAATVTPVDSPDKPLNLRASNITSTSITLTWEAVDEAESYIVLRELGDDLDEFDVDGTTYTDSGLTLNTTYVYTVIAVSSTGEESEESAPLSVTTFGDGSGKTALWGRRFREIDINADGLLSFEEFRMGHGGRLAWVIVKHRFDYSDSDETPGINLEEYAKSFGGRKFMSPSRPRQFYLADLDGDGELDPTEYPLIRSARTKITALENSFVKLDKDESGGLSPLELKIRNYVAPEPEEEDDI
jgi:hypothetical protein